MEELLNQGIFEPKATPEQTAALERLETLLALIEGWVQTVVDRRARRPDPRRVGAERDAAPPARHRRTRRADLRDAGRPGTAAPQAARGRGAVGAAHRGRRRRCPRRRVAAPRPAARFRRPRRARRFHRPGRSAATPAASSRRSPTSRRAAGRRRRRPRLRPVDNSSAGVARAVAESSHDALHARPRDAGVDPARRRRAGGLGSAARDARASTRRADRRRAGRSAAGHAVRRRRLADLRRWRSAAASNDAADGRTGGCAVDAGV